MQADGIPRGLALQAGTRAGPEPAILQQEVAHRTRAGGKSADGISEAAQPRHGRPNREMKRIILADNQAIFHAGAARVLALEEDKRIVAQCDDQTRLMSAVEAHRGAYLIVSTTMGLD